MSKLTSTTIRGYGAHHQTLRKEWDRRVQAGEVLCARCGRWIQPGTPWDLDHSDDRSRYLGPSHSRCNRAAPNRKNKNPPTYQQSLVMARLTLDEMADDWIRLNDPDADLTWPAVDEGRSRNTVSLTVAQFAADLAEVHEPAPRATLPDGPRCSWCDLAPVSTKRTRRGFGMTYTNLCDRCRKQVHRTDELPARRLNHRHRRRLGL